MIKYNVEKVLPANGSNVLAWDSEGVKTACYYVKDQFKKKYGQLDRGEVIEDVEWWAYAILDDRQSYLFDQFATLLALRSGEAEVQKWSMSMNDDQIEELLKEICGIRKSVNQYYNQKEV